VTPSKLTSLFISFHELQVLFYGSNFHKFKIFNYIFIKKPLLQTNPKITYVGNVQISYFKAKFVFLFGMQLLIKINF
jgi:hypothetical protein